MSHDRRDGLPESRLDKDRPVWVKSDASSPAEAADQLEMGSLSRVKGSTAVAADPFAERRYDRRNRHKAPTQPHSERVFSGISDRKHRLEAVRLLTTC